MDNPLSFPLKHPKTLLLLMVGLWWGLYQTLIPMSEFIVQLFPIERDSKLGSALQFFFYDTPKVLMLLTGVVMAMGMVNSYLHARADPCIIGRSA